MAINNVYNQTPKRIFTNKPFVNGMVYTNADLSPNVCRAVANLDMEASNTATRVRQCISNKAVTEDSVRNISFRFFNRMVTFNSYISEDLYNNDLIVSMPTGENILASGDLGMVVKTDTSNEPDKIFDKIIYNDSTLEWYSGSLNITNYRSLTAISNALHIYPLRLDNGEYPHCVNGNDYSFAFFGIITTDSTLVYKGLIKLYYHVTAQQLIIEVINPYKVDPLDVELYGANIISKNPLVYKDYIYYNGTDNNYTDYIGGQGEELNLIDISTVQVYDAPVNPNQYSIDSAANLVKGFDRTQDNTVYVRPYVALPKGNYNAAVSAKVTSNDNIQTGYYYDFNLDTFVEEVVDKSSISFEGNDLTFKTSYMDPFIQEGDLNTVKEDLISRMEYSDYNDNILNGDVLINIPRTIIASAPNDLSYGRFLEQDTAYEILRYAGHKVPAKSRLSGNNLLLSHMRLKINEQQLKINMTKISSDSENPTLLPMHFSATESVQVYMAKHNENIGQVGIAQNNVKLCDTYNKRILREDFKPIYNDDGSINSYYVTQNFSFGGYASLSSIRDVTISTGSSAEYANAEIEWNRQLVGNSIKISIKAVMPSLNAINYSAYLYFDIYGDKNLDILFESAKTVQSGLEVYYALYKHDTHLLGYPIIKADFTKFYDKSNSEWSYTVNLSSPYSFFTSQFSNALDPEDGSNIYSQTTTADYEWLSLEDYRNRFIENYYGVSSVEGMTRTYTLNITGVTHQVVNNHWSIPKSCTKPIQQITDSGQVSHSLSIPISTNAFNMSVFDNSPTVILEVSIFSGVQYGNTLFFKGENQVSKASAPIQINLSQLSIVNHTELGDSYNLLDRANNIALHLGHYVYYNSNVEDNSLFYSSYGDPSYFPSMYVITLDNPIVHVHPHQSSLVVFTTNDIYLIFNGNVPSTTLQDGSETPFTVKLIQSNIRLGANNYNTVRSIGKDVFFITDSNDGYLLKTNKYVSDASDTYLIKVTTAIDSLLNEPYEYAVNRCIDYKQTSTVHPTRLLEIPEIQSINRPTNVDEQLYSVTEIVTASSVEINVIDGDTLDIDGTRYRLAGINTPETTERLGNLATQRLKDLMKFAQDTNCRIDIYIPKDNTGNKITTYGRYVAYIFIDNTLINAEMLRAGLAKMAFDDYSDGLITSNNMTLHKYMVTVSAIAKYYNMGVYNTLNYSAISPETLTVYRHMPEAMVNHKYVYATNSYIYIINSIIAMEHIKLTVMFKYNIDNRTWTTYDMQGAIIPVDHTSDYSKTGFKLYCSNSYDNKYNKASVVSFEQGFIDYTNIVLDADNNATYTDTPDIHPINVYFDSGNQSIALMNDKLFREVKLFLGSAPDNILDISYGIRLYVDGKEVQPNTHYRGTQEDDQGFKKITFFTPARGRIPRVTFRIDCESDLNILQYALVYLQLNAK